MSTQRDVAVFVGSLRKDSLNRKMAHALADLAPEGFHLEIVEIGDLPLYNQDLDNGNPPAPWTALRDRVRRANAAMNLRISSWVLSLLSAPRSSNNLDAPPI